MRVQDWQVRQRLESFRDAYAAQHRTVQFQPHTVDTGLDYRGASFTLGQITQRTVTPAKDFPFLWIGNDYPCHDIEQLAGGEQLRSPLELLVRATLLSTGWRMFAGRAANGDTGWCAIQNTTGYGGTPQLFEYAYLVNSFEQIQFDYLLEQANNENEREFQHLLIGFKVLVS
jgi:hypothetical protein